MLERPTSACTPLWRKIQAQTAWKRAAAAEAQRIAEQERIRDLERAKRDEKRQKERETREYWREVREILGISHLSTRCTALRAESILYAILWHYNITYEAFFADTRKQSEAKPRWHCMYLLKLHFGWSTTQIGKFVHRHHSTVVHGLKRWNEIQEQEAQGQ